MSLPATAAVTDTSAAPTYDTTFPARLRPASEVYGFFSLSNTGNKTGIFHLSTTGILKLYSDDQFANFVSGGASTTQRAFAFSYATS
jgi:hypothetical protein